MNAATLDRSALAEAVDRYEPNACDSCPRGVPPSARPGNLRMAYTARTAAQECEPTLGAPLSAPAQRSKRDVEPRPTRELQMRQPLNGSSLDPLWIRFGPIELDEANARLICNGRPVTAGPRSFAVLCELARHPHTLMTKNALLDAVWGHRFVSESVLKTAISDLRASLHDDPKEPRYIETVSRRGYRFIAATAAIPSTAAIASAAPVREIDFSRQPSFDNGSEAPPCAPSAENAGFSGKRAVVCSIRNVDASRRETGCTLPQPVFATMEEVRYAHELRLQVRARLMRDATAPVQPWCVGAD